MTADRESIAASASDHVRAIVEAAEASAAEIRREAEEDVAGLRERVDAARRRLEEVRAELDAIAASLEGGTGAPREARGPAASAPAAAAAPAAAGDVEGARLVALNMALGGTPREETARYLSEHFAALPDAGALLDDVYASAAG